MSIDSPGLLRLEGTLTIRSIEEVHARLLAIMREHPAIVIDCSAATEIDLSFIQLLVAARRSGGASGRAVTLAQPPAGALLAALTRGGLLGPHTGTTSDTFWSEEIAQS
jgi:anti-anti-sigma regulatory factor